LIASIVMNNDGPFITVTQDNDLLQLLDHTIIYNPKTHKQLTKKDFLENTGLTECSQWCEVKTLGGCISDHVIGIPGVAEITAIKYINGIATKRIKEKIETFKITQEYKTNQWLVTLPLPGTPSIKLKPYKAPLLMDFIDFCSEYKIKSLSPKKWMDLFKME
jgi:5'-3' exonuclease